VQAAKLGDPSNYKNTNSQQKKRKIKLVHGTRISLKPRPASTHGVVCFPNTVHRRPQRQNSPFPRLSPSRAYPPQLRTQHVIAITVARCRLAPRTPKIYTLQDTYFRSRASPLFLTLSGYFSSQISYGELYLSVAADGTAGDIWVFFPFQTNYYIKDDWISLGAFTGGVKGRKLSGVGLLHGVLSVVISRGSGRYRVGHRGTIGWPKVCLCRQMAKGWVMIICV